MYKRYRGDNSEDAQLDKPGKVYEEESGLSQVPDMYLENTSVSYISGALGCVDKPFITGRYEFHEYEAHEDTDQEADITLVVKSVHGILSSANNPPPP